MRTPDRPPPIRLAFGALFWRLMGIFSLVFATLAAFFVYGWVAAGRRIPAFFLLMPMLSAIAFFLAAVITVAADLTVRTIVRPRLLRWQAPRAVEGQGPFHLDARERIEAESPARMALGRSWPAGRLVLTERRLLFLPNAWDLEPWQAARGRLRETRPVEHPRTFGGLVRGLPPRLEVVADDATSARFALPDADAWASIAPGPVPAAPTHERSFRLP